MLIVMQSRIVFFLMNIHNKYRTIYFARVWSESNLSIISTDYPAQSGQSLIEHSYKADSDLSPAGWEYADRLKDFVLERRAKTLEARGLNGEDRRLVVGYEHFVVIEPPHLHLRYGPLLVAGLITLPGHSLLIQHLTPRSLAEPLTRPRIPPFPVHPVHADLPLLLFQYPVRHRLRCHYSLLWHHLHRFCHHALRSSRNPKCLRSTQECGMGWTRIRLGRLIQRNGNDSWRILTCLGLLEPRATMI